MCQCPESAKASRIHLRKRVLTETCDARENLVDGLRPDEPRVPPQHRFYEKLNELLAEAKFDRRAEQIWARYFEARSQRGQQGPVEKNELPNDTFNVRLVFFSCSAWKAMFPSIR
jgi:hypothetical protein